MHKPSRVLIVTIMLPLWGVVRLGLSLATSCRSSLPVRISSSGIPYRYNLFLCLLEPVIECRVWNIVANAERVDGNSIGLTLGFVEEPQSFKIFFAKHNLSSFKFSTKVCERDMLVNTPILEAYAREYK